MLWPLVPDEQYMQMIYRKRQEAFLEEADRKRLIEKELPVKQSRLERMLFGVGAFLVSVGGRLRKRYAPMMPHGRKVRQTKIKVNKLSSYSRMKESTKSRNPKGRDWSEPSTNVTMISVEHGDC